MTSPWATAHVDVVIDWGDVDAELVRRLTRSSEIAERAVRRNFDKLAEGADRAFDRIAKSFDKTMRAMDRSSRTAVAKINQNLRGVEDVTARVNVVQTGATTQDIRATADALRRLQQDSGHIRSRIDIEINSIAEVRALEAALRALPRRQTVDVDVNVDQRGMSRATRSLAGIGSMFGRLVTGGLGAAATIGKLAGMAGAAALAVGSLVPVAAALGGALVAVGGAAGVMAVGGLFAAGVAAAALKTAFSGVGEAAKLALDPENAEKFEAALSKLAPSAQSAVRAFGSLGKTFKDTVQLPVQNSFFAGLGPKIEQLGRLMPSLRASLLSVADGFNEGANGALRMINSTAGMSMTKSLLAESGNIAGNFGAAITSLIPGFMALGSAATSVLSPMTDGMGGVARQWSETMLAMQQSGELQEKMAALVDVGKQVWGILKEVGGIVAAVFSAANEAGEGAFAGLADRLAQINDFLSAGEGREALIAFFQSSMAAMGALLPVLLQVAGIIGSTIAPMVADLIVQLGPVLSVMVDALGQAFAALQPAIGPLGDALSAIGTALAPVLPILGELIAQFVEIAGPIVGALATALGPVLQALGEGLVAAFAALQPAIEPITQVFQTLSPILTEVATMLGDLLAQAVSALIPVVETVAPIFAEILQALTPLLPVLGDALTQILDVLASMIADTATVWGDLLTQLLPLLPVLVEMVSTILPSLVDIVTALLPLMMLSVEMFAALLPLITPLLPPLIQLISWIANFTAVLFTLVADGIAGITRFAVSMLTHIARVGDIVLWLWHEAIEPAFRFIGDVATWLWETILKPAFEGIRDGFSAVGDVISSVWESVVQPVFDKFGSVVDGVKKGFEVAVDAIGAAWGKLRDYLAGPVKFVVDTVYNAGIRRVWNAVISKIPGIGELPEATWAAHARGGTVGRDGTQHLAVGGTVGRVVGPGTGTSDSVYTVAPVGAEVFTAREVRNAGGHRGLERLLAGLGARPWAQKALGRVAHVALSTGEWVASPQMVGRLGGRQGIRALRATLAAGPMPRHFLGDVVDAVVDNTVGRAVDTGRGVVADGFRVALDAVGRGIPDVLPPGGDWGRIPKNTFNGTKDGLVKAIRGHATGGTVGGREPYGLPVGTSIGYGQQGFPQWVYDLGQRFNVKPSTYPGHQERDGQNKGIDWSGSTSDMQRFAEHLLGNAGDLEQVIWSNPETGEKIGVADGQRVGPGTSQPGYYSADWSGHQDHVHTRQSYALGLSTGKGIDDTLSTSQSSLSSGAGTPIGSGIGSGSGSGSGSGGSWGNSGGSSKFDSSADAKRGGLTPVWVENWPSSMGGSSSSSSLSTGATGTTLSTGTGTAPAKDLKKGASKQAMVDEVVRQGKAKGMSDADIESAVAVMLAESDGKNYANSNVAGSTDRPHDAVGSDGKSLGVMQQQSGMGWGSDDQLMDPTYAIGKYYERLGEVPGREQMSVAQRAQAVQRSAYADGANFAAKQDEAKKLIAAAGTVPTTPAGNVPVEVTNVGVGVDGSQQVPGSLPDLAGSPSAIGGNLATWATKPGFDGFLAAHPELSNEGVRSRLSDGLMGALNAGVAGQIGGGLDMFGLNFEPHALSAFNQYMGDNTGGDDKNTKLLADAIRELAVRPIEVVVHGGGDARAIAEEVQAKVAAQQKTAMRRYLHT